jgi:hypothetical protein
LPPGKMNSSDPVLFVQIQYVKKIVDDETWLEGERRGQPVSPDDQVVRENVCQVIMRVGREMRCAALAALGQDSSARPDAA